MRTLSIAFIALLFSVFTSCKKEDQNEPDIMKVDYEIAIDDSFQLVLVSNMSTGYSWAWTNKQSVSIVDTFDYKYILDEPILDGSGGKEIWKFKGKKIGIDTIKLEYKRPWDSNSTVDSKTIVVKVK